MVNDDLKSLIIFTTLIFLIAPVFIIIYIFVYNQRKKRHIEEKAQMKLTFDSELAKTQLEVQEQTMQTIGADLHDNIGQLLSLTSLTLNSIEIAEPDKAQQKIATVIDLTKRSIKEMRLLGKLLQGDQLIGLGLPKAIAYEVEWMERSGQFFIEYIRDGEIPAVINKDKDLIIFRIMQESLNNIMKHAHATQISIRLRYFEQTLQLKIDDNGVGFDMESPQNTKAGMGLQNIHKRVAIIGGEVSIVSKPSQGTVIAIYVPYP